MVVCIPAVARVITRSRCSGLPAKGYTPLMTQDKAGEAREGFVDSITGKAKEVTGAVVGNDDLVEEGQLQQAEARSRKEAAAHDAIADAEQSEAAETLRESSREAQIQQEAASAAAERDKAGVQQRHATEYVVADREGELQEHRGEQAAKARGDQIAEAGLRDAAAIAEEAEATEQSAQAEKSRLEREAAEAAKEAAQLRAQATTEGAS